MTKFRQDGTVLNSKETDYKPHADLVVKEDSFKLVLAGTPAGNDQAGLEVALRHLWDITGRRQVNYTNGRRQV